MCEIFTAQAILQEKVKILEEDAKTLVVEHRRAYEKLWRTRRYIKSFQDAIKALDEVLKENQ